ncbi:hypothetical protein BH11ACT2_BH11ACT2_11980 [soil metagenome]
MADQRLIPRPAYTRRLLGVTVRYRLAPWWLRVTVVFVASRLITTGLLLATAAGQAANPWTGAHPSYLDYAKIWDGHWYYIVALVGYPGTLPMTDTGNVGENQWAFMPGYPMLVRALMLITGLDFKPLAVFVSVAFAFGTVLVFYKLLVRVLPSGTALFAVVLYCVAPLSPILQVAYAESMFLFFVTLGLYLLVERRYVALLPVIVVMSLTRPGGLAFALTIGIQIVVRYRGRRTDAFGLRERIEAAVALVVSIAAGLAWIVVAGVVTGVAGAYTQTELAWRSVYIGYRELIPFTSWLYGANWWIPLPYGPILLVLATVMVALLLFTPWVRRLGVELRAWLASYLLYVLAVFFPQSSTFRILMPLFPALGAIAQPRSPVYRVSIVLACVALQAGWLHIAWWYDGYDWTPP